MRIRMLPLPPGSPWGWLAEACGRGAGKGAGEDLPLALSGPSPSGAVWALEDPYGFDPGAFKDARWRFSCDRGAARRYDPPAVHLPFGFDDRAPLPEAGDDWDVAFVWKPTPRRVIVLQACQGFLASCRTVVAGPGWAGLLDPGIRVLDRHLPWNEVRSLWARSRVVLQIHREHFFENPRRIPPESPSVCVFEAAGIGACQAIDDSRPGTREAFKEGLEWASFQGPGALPGVLEGLLDDPGRRRRIGGAAREHALAEHSLSWRMETLIRSVLSPILPAP